MIAKREQSISMSDESMWDIDFESFLTKLDDEHVSCVELSSSSCLTSKQVRMPGHVVTTEALQRLCITHVQTRSIEERMNDGFEITSSHNRQSNGEEKQTGNEKDNG